MPQATSGNTSPKRPNNDPYIILRARAREGSALRDHSMNYVKLRRKALASKACGKLLELARLPELKIVKTAGFIVSCIL